MNYNKRHNFRPKDRGFKRWDKVNNTDYSYHANNVGYVIVRGRTKEECINSLKNAVVHLNPWAQRQFGQNMVSSNGNIEGIITVCNFFFARAYMTINKRSMQNSIDRARQDKQVGLFRGRELHHRLGQTKENDDATVKWKQLRPWGMIDCDIDDPKGQKELDDFLAKNGITPVKTYLSHDGKHYILDKRDAENLDFSFLKKYNSNNRPNDPNCEFKGDAKMIIYSATGI